MARTVLATVLACGDGRLKITRDTRNGMQKLGFMHTGPVEHKSSTLPAFFVLFRILPVRIACRILDWVELFEVDFLLNEYSLLIQLPHIFGD